MKFDRYIKNKKRLIVLTFLGVSSILVLAAYTYHIRFNSTDLSNNYPLSYPVINEPAVAGEEIEVQNEKIDKPEVEVNHNSVVSESEPVKPAPQTIYTKPSRPHFVKIFKQEPSIIKYNYNQPDGGREIGFNTLIVLTSDEITTESKVNPNIIKWFAQTSTLSKTFFTQGNYVEYQKFNITASACADTTITITVEVTDPKNNLTVTDSTTETISSFCPRPAHLLPTVEIFTPTPGQIYYNVPEAYPYEMSPRHCPYYVDIYLSGRIIDPLKGGQIPDKDMYWFTNDGSESANGNNFNFRFCGRWGTPANYTVVLSYAINHNTFADKRVQITIMPPQ